MPPDVLSLPAPPADCRVPYGAEASQFVDFRFPRRSPDRGLVIYLHGGFWRARRDLTHAGLLCAALAEEGFVSANVEYRRAGEPGGGWPGTYSDILAAIAFVANRCHAPGALGTHLIGHSAGGHLALRVAVGPVAAPLSQVIALAPAVPLLSACRRNLGDGAVAEFLGGPPEKLPDVYAQACPSLWPAAVPATLIHGTGDDIVPVDLAREFVASRANWSQCAPALLLEIPGADHFDLIDPRSAAWPMVVNQLVKPVTASV